VRWTWDPDKAAANRAKHGLSFETAVQVFDDPLHASKPDPHPGGDRWHTIGLVLLSQKAAGNCGQNQLLGEILISAEV